MCLQNMEDTKLFVSFITENCLVKLTEHHAKFTLLQICTSAAPVFSLYDDAQSCCSKNLRVEHHLIFIPKWFGILIYEMQILNKVMLSKELS